MPDFLKITDLRKSYYIAGKEVPVLNGINITINKGDMISITGVSGVGKSTFLQVVGTLDKPTSGTINYGGQNVFEKNEKNISLFRNKTIGFVYQLHHLLPEFTALDNVKIPMMISGINKKYADEKAKFYLSEVGLSHRFNHKPGEISGGEQQRVAIARSLVMEPSIVLADEPTGNLDRKTATYVEDLMISLNQKHKITFILATHNEELAARLTKKLRLYNGIFK